MLRSSMKSVRDPNRPKSAVCFKDTKGDRSRPLKDNDNADQDGIRPVNPFTRFMRGVKGK